MKIFLYSFNSWVAVALVSKCAHLSRVIHVWNLNSRSAPRLANEISQFGIVEQKPTNFYLYDRRYILLLTLAVLSFTDMSEVLNYDLGLYICRTKSFKVARFVQEKYFAHLPQSNHLTEITCHILVVYDPKISRFMAFVAVLFLCWVNFSTTIQDIHNLDVVLFLTSLLPFESFTHINREFFVSGANRHFSCRSLLHPILLRSFARLFVLLCIIPYDFIFHISQ